MTENGIRERERRAFVAGASWRHTHESVTRRPAEAEAANRYPVVDVQQAPSGRWYRLTQQRSGDMDWLEIAAWESEEKAIVGGLPRWVGIVSGDETTVASLLTRHARRIP